MVDRLPSTRVSASMHVASTDAFFTRLEGECLRMKSSNNQSHCFRMKICSCVKTAEMFRKSVIDASGLASVFGVSKKRLEI